MKDYISFLSKIRRVGFGGLLGCSAGIFLCILFPGLLSETVTVHVIMVLGTSLGAGISIFVEKVLTLFGILPGFIRYSKQYWRIINLWLFTRLIDKESGKKVYNAICKALIVKFFLGDEFKIDNEKINDLILNSSINASQDESENEELDLSHLDESEYTGITNESSTDDTDINKQTKKEIPKADIE